MIYIHKLVNSKYDIYLEIALILNKSIYDEKKIDYHIYKMTEDKLLEMIKTAKSEILEGEC